MSLNNEQQKAVNELRRAINEPYNVVGQRVCQGDVESKAEAVIRELEQAQRERDLAKAAYEQYRVDFNEAAEAFEQLASNFPAIQTDCEGPVKAAQFINMAYEKLRAERDDLRAKLEKIVGLEPASDGCGGLFYAHFDGEGNEVGIQNVDPLSLLQEIFGIARTALNRNEP